jgi:CxxC-x17-CxxC domain-containing protein
MGGFNKFDKGGRDGGRGFGGGNRFGGERKFGGRGDRHSDIPRQMFPATCSQCGQSCEVPFKPTGNHPVFCRNCFKNQAGGERNQRPSFSSAPKSFSGGPIGGGNFSSTPSAPVTSHTNTGGGISKAQIDAMNVKIDKILALLTEKAPKIETAKIETPKVIAEVKTIKKTPVKKSAPAKKAKAKK